MQFIEFISEMYEVMREARETNAVDKQGRNVELYFGDMMRRLEDAVDLVNERIIKNGGNLTATEQPSSTYPTRIERQAARKVLEQVVEHGAKVLGDLGRDRRRGRYVLAALSGSADILRRDPDMFFKALAVEIEGEIAEQEGK